MRIFFKLFLQVHAGRIIMIMKILKDLPSIKQATLKRYEKLMKYFNLLCYLATVSTIMDFRSFLSFIDPERGGFGEIFPEVMIFPEGFSPREISSLKEIFRRISRAEGL